VRRHGLRGGRPLRTALVVAFVVLGGCATRVSTRAFTLAAAPEANDRSPVPVDLVLVRDPALVEVMGALSARAWFESRVQLARDHPDAFESREWELVPGQRIEIDFPFRSHKGEALYVFANYRSPGAHRVRVDLLKHFTIVLEREGFSVASD
jgi:type VI secretion system protein